MKRITSVLLAVIILCSMIAGASAQNEESYFKVVFLDVGEGDAAYLECDGYTMLIDGGNASCSSLIYSFLKQNDIKRLDYIVASHPDADHIGGLSGALNFAQSGIVLCTVDEHDTRPFESFLKYLEAQNNHITVPDKGDTFSFGSAKIQILSPERGKINSANTSLVLRVTFGETSFLFTGDSEIEDEAELISAEDNLKSTVLKVAHHGSASSTSSAFLERVSPEYAVISVGGENSYGHPSEEVIERLSSVNAGILRTDLNGEITLTSDGHSIAVEVEKGGDEKGEELISTADGAEAGPSRAAAAPEDASAEEPAGEGVTYIININSGRFHHPSCSSVEKMKESNKRYYTGTRDELIAQGCSPCENCKP